MSFPHRCAHHRRSSFPNRIYDNSGNGCCRRNGPFLFHPSSIGLVGSSVHCIGCFLRIHAVHDRFRWSVSVLPSDCIPSIVPKGIRSIGSNLLLIQKYGIVVPFPPRSPSYSLLGTIGTSIRSSTRDNLVMVSHTDVLQKCVCHACGSG